MTEIDAVLAELFADLYARLSGPTDRARLAALERELAALRSAADVAERGRAQPALLAGGAAR